MLKRITAALAALWLALAPVAALADNGCLLGVCRAAAAAGGGVTFDSGNQDSHISSLGSGSLAPVADGSGTYGSVRSTTGHSTGKFCFSETAASTGVWEIGFIASTDALTGDVASQPGAYALFGAGGQVYHNGSPTGMPGFGGAIADASTMTFCADFTAGKGWIKYSATGQWNGNGTDDPATATGGFTMTTSVTYYAVFSGKSGDTATFNFATPTLPSGFSAW